MPKPYWTIETYLKELQQFYSENAEALKTTSLSRLLFSSGHSNLYHAAAKFGGLHKLNNEFQLELPLRRRQWTEEIIVEELKALHKAGYPINHRTLRKIGHSALAGAILRFGSTIDFKEKAGLTVKRKRSWTKKQIADAYKTLAQRLKTAPTAKQLEEHGLGDIINPIHKEFGTLTALRIKIHIRGNRNHPCYWTLENLRIQLKTFVLKNKTGLRKEAFGTLLKKKNRKLFFAANEFGGLTRLNTEFKLGVKMTSDDWSEKAILRELKVLHSAGFPLTEKNLQKCKIRLLSSAIGKTGSLSAYKQKLGIPSRKKREKWTRAKVLDGYRRIYQQEGKIPSLEYLRQSGNSGLISAGFKFFKNMMDIYEAASIPIRRKSRKYWTLENTVIELKGFIAANLDYKGDIIVKLREAGRADLVGAIYKHNGLRRLNDDFGLNMDLQRLSWSKKELLDTMQTLHDSGVILTQNNLKTLGRNDVLGAAQKFGGFNNCKIKLGLPIARHGHWSEQKIIRELKPIVKNFGRIPSKHVLKAMGKGDLASAIRKYGGAKKYSTLLKVCATGYFKANDNHYVCSGYECLFDNILFKHNVPHTVNGAISSKANFRYDFLIGDTHIEICGYDKKEHPAYYKRFAQKKRLYKRLGLKFVIIPKAFFNKKFSEIEQGAVNIISDILPIPPLEKNAFHHDIIPVHRWKDLKNVKKALTPLVKKYGRVPFDRELRLERQASLIHGVYKFHGSFYDVAQKLKLKIQYKPKGYYTEQNAILEYRQLCKKFKRILTQSDLQKMKCFGLLGYIAKNGGLIRFRLRMEESPPA